MMDLMVTPAHYVMLAAILFGLGAFGALTRRSGLMLLMCVELMLNAANLVFVAYGKQYGDTGGQVIAFFIMAIAAAEAAVGLAILIGVFRTRLNLDVDDLTSLRDEV
ncbi:MAG: NADH-quinone oxidoreductase subunit NuoK [Myxococcota bacterium]|jgi:NADH-quinone oxidoreductase subunit K|nr:NADH-quinone oxidoreductase subunit NuoK [Myxococcota bacterium]